MTLVRSALFQIYFLMATLIIAIVGLPAPFFGEKPARNVVKIWARTILFGLAIICGVRHRIEGAENIPEGGAIVAANHQSWWDTLALYAILERPVAVFKQELLSVPIVGWWGLKAGSIAIDRKAGVRAIRAMTRHAAEKIAEGCQMIVFPEGTRMPLGVRGPLQPGVAGIYIASGARVTPAVHNSGRHWRHPGWLKVPGVITLRFVPPIEPGLDRHAFLATLAAEIDAARDDLPTAPAAPVAAAAGRGAA